MNQSSQEQRETIRRQAIERFKKANRVYELATITARHDREEWPVTIKIRADEYFYVAGRDTGFDVYITETNAGFLVSIPNHKRCGYVPADCNAYDVMDYIDIDNQVDATTLAAAIKHIIRMGLVSKHPSPSHSLPRIPSDS